MKIGGFEVGPFIFKESGGKKHLIFDCRDCVYSSSLADDFHCRIHANRALMEGDADLIVLAEVYERVYNEKQTKYFTEVSQLLQKFEIDGIWSYSHLGDAAAEGEALFGQRHDSVVAITHDNLVYDPISSYIRCLQEIRKEREELPKRDKKSEVYLNTLMSIKSSLEKLSLIGDAKQILLNLKKIPDTGELYRTFLEAQIKPSFIGSRLMFEEMEKLELLDEYTVKNSTVQIFNHPNKTEKMYFINPPEYSLAPEKYFVLSKTRETVAGYAPGKTTLSAIAKSRKYFERVYQSTIRDICTANNIKLTKEEIVELSEIVARYTVGYGILEILLSDRKLTDIYLDSPIGQRPMYGVHSDFGPCQTNVIYTEEEASALVSKMRAMSGRPFDEAHPVLDFDLPDQDTRVAVIGPPLAPDGTAFAFRLHKVTPWTLPQFLDAKFMPPLCAGLMSFFIDNQATMLVTGSRGSGKTSLMGALMLEIPQNSRIIVQEDTLELSVPYMKNIGYNVQRLKTKSPIGGSKSDTEVAPEEALRTALRLGDSALIVGEVRSREAKVLYEAMRVGAAGNIVMGTIHGDSAYSVWDRVVNDLGVPTTSFKATDVVVVARPIRFKGSLKRVRRITQVTEVKKHWTTDPYVENGLLDLMLYEAGTDNLDLLEDNLKDSDLFSKIGSSSGLTIEEMWKSIKMNGSSKQFLVDMKKEYNLPILLEAENTVFANSKLLLLKEKQISEHGSVDYDALLGEWKNWVRNYLVKRLLQRKKAAEEG